MDETKTVSLGLDLYAAQTEYVQQMRDHVKAFSANDPLAAKKAIQNITILRVYHQISRIIKYLDLMDRIEDKMYESIDCSLQEMDSYDPTTWSKLCYLQTQLQKSMVESHKLLEPYLDFQQLSIVEAPAEANDPADSFASMILNQESREKIRTSAQEVLAAISATESEADHE